MNEHERLNFYRLSLLIMDGGTPTLKWLFEKQYAASGDLEIFLKSKRTILDDLYKKRKIINQRQMDLLRPSTGIKPSVEQFDTSLLITLLTNICPIQQPLGGWTVFPAASDLCPGADILRVRDARNNLFHHAKCGISDAEFQLESSNVSAAISRLSNQLDQQQQVNIQKIIDDASNAARDFGREKEICNLIFIDKIDEIHNLVQGIYHRGNDGVITGLAVSEAIHSLLEDDKHDGTTDQPDMCFTLGENSIIIVVKLYADLKKELTREIVMSIAKVLFKEDNSTDVLEEIEQASSRRLCIDSLLKRVIHREAATVQSFLKEIHSKCPRMADVLAKTIITEEDCKKFQLIDDRVHANGRISSKVHTRCRIDESDVKFFQRCLYYSPENVDKIADVLLSKLYISFSDHSRVSLQSDVFTRIYVLFEIIRSCHLDSVSELENVLGSELYKEWIIFRNETSGPNGENTGVWQSIIQRIGGAASSLMDSICQTFNIHFIRSERGSLVLIFKAGDNFNIELLKPEAVKMKVRELLEKTCPAHHPLFKDPIHVTVFIKSAQYGEKEEIHFVLEKVRDRKEIEDGHSHFGRHERDYMIEEMDPAPLEKWMFERFKIDECTKIHLEDIISWNDIGRGEKMKILIDTLERFEDGYELMQRYCEENDKFVYDKVFQKGRQQSRTGHNTEVGYDKGEGMQKVFTTWIDFSENPTDAGNPVNILNMDDRSIQLFKNALKDGKEKDYSIRVMVIGHYGVGKTTLIQRLLGKNVNISERHSTEGIDIHLHCCDVSLSSREWTLREKDADQYSRLQRLVRLLNEHSHRQESKREQERQREFDDHVTSVEYDNEHTKQNQHVSKKRNYGHPQQDKHVSAQPGTYQKVNPPSSQPVESPIVRLDPEASSGIDSKNNQKDTVMELLILVKEKSDKVEKHSGEYAALTFWDFSGRYLFYATHQAFLTRRAIYLLVIDFSQQVTDLVDDECYLDAEGIKLCNVHELTEIWLNMIHCCAPSYYYGNPPVILVGTHVDKIPEKNRQKVINEYFIKIRQMLKNKPLVFHLMDNIAIDNTIDNAQRDPRMEHLKRRIFDLASHQPHWGEEKPARWIPLEEAIMKIKASGVKVAPLSLIEEINRSSSVKIEDRYELDVFLHFQHDTGMIVYFNANGLKDMIVLDPQWMFDALKSLITDHRFIEQNPTVTKEWYAFNNKGKLTHELIDAIWTKKDKPDFHDNKNYLIILMEKLNIIAKPMSYTMDGKSVKEEDYYLAPCILRQKTPREIICPESGPGQERTSALCFVCKGKFLPPPFFHRLVGACLMHWPIAMQNNETLIYCGCCVFDIDKYHRLYLHFLGHVIFARVTIMEVKNISHSSKLCSEARMFIFENLLKIIGNLGQRLEFEPHIQCPDCDADSLDGMIAMPRLQNETVVCKSHVRPHTLVSRQLLQFWFEDGKQTVSKEKRRGKGFKVDETREVHEKVPITSRSTEKLHQTVLNRCLPKLMTGLNVEVVMVYIQDNELFDDVTIRDINEQATATYKISHLIAQIKKRGQDTYERFKECLVLSQQDDLKEMLDEEETKVAAEMKSKRQGMATVNFVGFHEIKGDNVLIHDKTAAWNPVANWAIAFSKEPLSVGVPVILEIEGSGHIDLGIIQRDPQVLKDRMLSRPQDIQEYSRINKVMVHKRKCNIRFTLEPGGARIVANYSGTSYKQTINPGAKVWLASYVLFGDITLKLRHDREAEAGDNPVVSDIKGMNLEFCANGKNEVRTVSPNPAAICFISKSLIIGQKMSFLCDPLKNSQGELPSRFCLKIYITNKEPKQLQQQYKNLFTITAANISAPKWVCSTVMERQNCKGQVTIERTVDSLILTNGMNERIKEEISADQKKELWVGLELYRVAVRQVEVCTVYMDTKDGASDVYVSPVLEAERSNENWEFKPKEQKKKKEMKQQNDKCCPLERNEAVQSFISVTGDDLDVITDGYLNPITESNNEYLELIPEQQYKQYSHSGRAESIQSYTYVTGNESDLKQENISCIQEESTSVSSKPESIIAAKDLVHFESSYNACFVDLVKDLSALELCDHLISLQIITMPELERIMRKDTSHDQNRELLFLLCRKPVPRSKFIVALKDSGNGHLSKMFFPEL